MLSAMTESSDVCEPLRVLIVEDNYDARTTLRLLLEMAYGHVVYDADDGLRGVQIALEQRPDVALIDVGLPGLNGYEVARRIREQLTPEQMCLVALTGYSSDEDRRKAEDAGFDVHLVKPVGSAALEQALTRQRAPRVSRQR
jgi:CheY-like chemotaxis protein